jgi:hypothetical protein
VPHAASGEILSGYTLLDKKCLHRLRTLDR